MYRVRRSLDRRDAGFTVIEVLVAFVLLAIVASAMVPILVVTAKAATLARYETQGKNLSQERFEQMRQLTFHVDRQNGPFVDLLDNYYPNRSAAVGNGPGWVAEGTARQPGEPTTGAFYRVVFAPLPGDPDFSQTVATQFLRFTRSPVPQAGFASYDSQVSGVDSPPSLFLGVSVITTWTVAGEPKSLSTFTQIADPGAATTLIATQARATALRTESTAPDLSYLTSEGGAVLADGRLSDGSSASVQLSAGKATSTTGTSLESAVATAVAPTGAQPGTVTKNAITNGATCGYGAFGRGEVTRATSDVADGVPLAPADVGVASVVPTNQSQAALLADPGGGCGAYWFDNQSPVTDPRLQLLAGRPLVWVAGTTAGSAPVVEARGWLTGTDENASPRFVRAGAGASTPERVGLFYTTFTGDADPLISFRLVSSELRCDSSTPTAPVGSYQVSVDYRRADGTREQLTDFSWSSTSGPSIDPLASIDLTAKEVLPASGAEPALTLADYIDSWQLGTALTKGDGIASIDAALRITSVPVRSLDPASSVGIVAGSLSCAADDNR